MCSFFKKKKELPKGVGSEISKIWRELYSIPLIKLLSNENIPESSIKEAFSLLFFIATDENLNDCVTYITQKNDKKLSEMANRIPFDFDEKEYPTYDIVYIIGKEKNYFVIVYDTGENAKKDISLKRIIETENIDISIFLGKRLIYPI